MSKQIQVMLIEDNPEYSEVIKLALDNEPGIELSHHFGTSEIAVRQLQTGSIEKAPDLILLDIRLPGMSGLDSIPLLSQCIPQAKIMILTQSNQEADVLKAISLGASGYLLKSATLEQLTESIRTVIAGGAPLDAGVARFILNSLQSRLVPESKQPSTTTGKEPATGILSQRELEILNLLAEGCVKKEIAQRLEIGYTTVDTHVSRIYAKLKVGNAPSAVNKAHRLNLLPTNDDQTN